MTGLVARVVALAAAVTLLAVPVAEAGVACRWFGRCLYESAGFTIFVVDKATGAAVEGVHAMAEWVMYAHGRRNGPLMVQDAMSDVAGKVTFPAWGPIRGGREGLVLNTDPAITLFKPGYKVLIVWNAFPVGADETDRHRTFVQDGKVVAMEPFQGTAEQWLEELYKAAYPAVKGSSSDDQIARFRAEYLRRRRQVWTEIQKLSLDSRDFHNRKDSFERNLKYLEDLKP